MFLLPAPFELGESTQVVEQIIRPTGLLDPEVIVRPIQGQSMTFMVRSGSGWSGTSGSCDDLN